MNLKYIFLLFVTTVISVIFISCSKDNPVIPPVNSDTFTYPISDGNYWKYTYSNTITDYKPDSIRNYILTTPPFTTTVTVLYDTVINSVTTKCFQEEATISGGTFKSWNYYINTDTAFLLFASRGSSSTLPTDKIKSPESFQLYDPPQKILIYPVVSGKTWNPDTSVSYTKKYHSFENISTIAGIYSCMKTERTFSTPTYLYSYFDYYSAKGLLKSYAFFNDMLVTTPQYPEGIGTVDLEVNVVLTEINVH